jgi:RNA polymerase sigma-70 factor (ECF subfamily)
MDPLDDEAHEVTLVDDSAPDLLFLRAELHEPFRRSLSAALAELTPTDRTLLRLRLISGLTLEQIADLYRLHRTTVIRRLVQARELLHRATRRRLMKELSLSLGELSSIVRLLRSELPAVLRSHLRTELR